MVQQLELVTFDGNFSFECRFDAKQIGKQGSVPQEHDAGLFLEDEATKKQKKREAGELRRRTAYPSHHHRHWSFPRTNRYIYEQAPLSC